MCHLEREGILVFRNKSFDNLNTTFFHFIYVFSILITALPKDFQ